MDNERQIGGMEEVHEAEGGGTLSVLAKAEINQQIATAKQFPRSVTNFVREAEQLATMNEEMARQCVYALPRGGKVIEGPSARFAEVMAYSFRNMRYGARPISEDEEFITSQGVAYDLERNNGVTIEVRRRITNNKNERFNADMIGVTANAANSIALRNAVLKIIPKALWNPIYQKARATIMGDFKTFNNRLGEMFEQFTRYGVSKEMICAKLGKQGVADIKIEDMVILAGILTAMQEGDSTPDQMFAQTSEQVRQPTQRREPEPAAAAAAPKPADAAAQQENAAATPGTRKRRESQGQQPPAPVAPGTSQTSPKDDAERTRTHMETGGTERVAGSSTAVTENMVKQIELRIESYDIDRNKLMGNFGVTKLEELQAADVNKVLEWIEKNAS